MKKGKFIIISAPSGAGKSTVISLVKGHIPNYHFSRSCTTRQPRGEEMHGREYFFITEAEFQKRIDNDEFVESEKVYNKGWYGSLKSETIEMAEKGNNVMFDVDVKGGMSLKKIYGKNAVSIFIMPPSIEELERRLLKRNTDKPEKIRERVDKAKSEIEYANNFDHVVLNDDLDKCVKETIDIINDFLGQKE